MTTRRDVFNLVGVHSLEAEIPTVTNLDAFAVHRVPEPKRKRDRELIRLSSGMTDHNVVSITDEFARDLSIMTLPLGNRMRFDPMAGVTHKITVQLVGDSIKHIRFNDEMRLIDATGLKKRFRVTNFNATYTAGTEPMASIELIEIME